MQICESYDVLSDPVKKRIYDNYGDYGLKNGVTDELGNKFKGYSYLRNADQIYDKFMENTNPFENLFELNGSDVYGSLLGDAYGGQNQPKPAAPKDIEITLKCSLQEFYNGSIKKFVYTRNEVIPNKRQPIPIEEELHVEVKPGFVDGQLLTIKGKGHEEFLHKRGDIKIKLVQDDTKCPTSYVRRGNNLIYTHCLTLEQALTSETIKICTLDDRIININLDQMITPQLIHQIEGEGMPILVKTTEEELENNLKTLS